MNRPSDGTEATVYYVHARRKPKGAFLLARVRGRESDIMVPPEYPAELVDRAIEHLGYMLAGMFMTSLFEWWAVDEEPPQDVVEALGAAAQDFSALVRRAWQAHDESRPHGSPLGRAGGEEPPAPAAD